MGGTTERIAALREALAFLDRHDHYEGLSGGGSCCGRGLVMDFRDYVRKAEKEQEQRKQ